MKQFLSILAVCVIIVYGILFFMNTINNGWLNLAIISLVMAVLVNSVVNHRVRIEELDSRVRALEEKAHIKPKQSDK